MNIAWISRYLFHCAEFLAAVTPFLHYQSSQASSASHFVIFAPHIDHPRPMPRPMPRSGIKKIQVFQVLSGAVWCCRFWKPLCKQQAQVRSDDQTGAAAQRSVFKKQRELDLFLPFIPYFHVLSHFLFIFPSFIL